MNSRQLSYDLGGKKVFVTGHRGMVGSAIVRQLESRGDVTLTTAGRQQLDLRNQSEVFDFFKKHKPDAVFVAAATVGGIFANSTRPAEFLYDNIAIESNIIEASHRNDVEKVVFLGSSCIYPKMAEQPMSEDALLTGPLEPTNQWYAIAKIAGIKLVQAYREQYGRRYISVMPTNLYGPGDNFNLDFAHVIPALMRKAHEAKLANASSMTVWGSGKVRREFLYVDDLADAVVFLASHYDGEQHINVGTGEDVTIAEVAAKICKVVGFEGTLEYDASKPDGTPRKLLDVSKIEAQGWSSNTSLEEGLRLMYAWFCKNIEDNMIRG